jgi:hypothetical protein
VRVQNIPSITRKEEEVLWESLIDQRAGSYTFGTS